MFKKVLILLLALAVPFVVLAQSSGKIVGVVTDKESGEPLPGVNVVVKGTFMGSTTDVDGYYIILNVPVGTYTLEASYVGYTPVAVQNVKVSADVTTEQNFQLQPTTLQLEEAVVVVAERPLVEKHVTYSAAKFTTEEIANAPIRGVQSFMAYMPSVVIQNGAINIRGGRGEEVGYYVDGASTLNPVNRTNQVYVIQEAIEEVKVLTGGFGAEYGDANSGIVKTQLKQGTPDFHFSITGETDKFASEGEKFLDTYSYRDHILAATVSGPITNNIRFFLAGEWESIGDTRKRFSTGYTLENRIDGNPANPDVSGGFPDTVTLTYPNGFTPNNWRDRYTLNSTFSFNFDPFRLRLSGIFSNRRSVSTSSPMLTYLNKRWVEDVNNHMLFTGKFTHVLSAKTYYDVNLSYFYSAWDEEDPYFGNDWQKWADSSAVAQATNGEVTYRDAWRGPYQYWFNGIGFSRNGGYETYNKSKQTYFGGGIDLVSQLTKHHEVKFGFNGRAYTIRQYSVNPFIMAFLDQDYPYVSAHYNSLDEIPYTTYRSYIGNTYGYDLKGNEINDGGFDGPRNPIIGAAYVTDKIEYQDLIINLGLRLDYFDPDDYTLRNPRNAQVDQTTGTILPSEWVKIKPHIHLSPRIGISFPVSETTKFYTQYGKFVQMPEFNNFYYNNYQYGRQIVTGGYFYLTPVGYGFDPIFTTSYELGFNKQLGDFAAIDIAGFYKNVQGQIQATRITPEPNAPIVTYNALRNGDFATNKGLEFKLTMRRYNRMQAQLNYTLTDAEGTGSGKTAYISAVDRGAQPPTVLSPLDFSQTHRGNLILDYRFGKDDGGPILEQLGINLMYRFNSGHPYTKVKNVGGQSGPYDGGVDYMFDTRSRTALEPINASTTPWTSNVDLRIDKSFDIMDNMKATVYVRVTNLFNTKNVLNVYQETGSDTDDGYITDPNRYGPNYNNYGGEQYLETYRALNTVNGSSYLSQLGLELWDHPRQILFGLKIVY
ncbi:MAG TPA: TonB-dependent receptor [Caldithrix abyssi]|uniref:TonB-dependent receptor n=1 Tax=Caldithrix abyssi TaxID=187145 RepID=A0A7V4WUN4_CALAY|nr:TonB-dependent receptor [Caldithrix abyssi]